MTEMTRSPRDLSGRAANEVSHQCLNHGCNFEERLPRVSLIDDGYTADVIEAQRQDARETVVHDVG